MKIRAPDKSQVIKEGTKISRLWLTGAEKTIKNVGNSFGGAGRNVIISAIAPCSGYIKTTNPTKNVRILIGIIFSNSFVKDDVNWNKNNVRGSIFCVAIITNDCVYIRSAKNDTNNNGEFVVESNNGMFSNHYSNNAEEDFVSFFTNPSKT